MVKIRSEALMMMMTPTVTPEKSVGWSDCAFKLTRWGAWVVAAFSAKRRT